ncbi:MAG: DUF4340 domain-containing protein [Candidatus Rokubacteria bacterium]|nr:DUF4340 domain-containing protein [Candidatus Rokubacteria bacterium]
MRWKTTAVLAVLLVGLATFFYVYDVKQAPEREKSAAEKDRVWKGLESKDIEEVAITRKGETLQLKKSGDAWSLASPVQGRAESQPVQDMLGSLASLRVEREIEPRPSKPADFGLETPAAEISFTAKGAKHRVRLGTKNPTGLWVYAQLDDKPAVVLVPDSLLRDAEKPVADFRDRTVLTFEKKDVKGLEVRTPGGQQVAAQLKGPEDWQVTSPLPVKADREQVSGLLDKLKAVKIKEFVTEAPKGPDPYGLDRPLALTLWLGEEKERSAKTLRLGKAVPEKKAIYAQREGDPTVFTVEEDLLKAVPTSSTALREKTVFTYDRGKLERVELESPKGKVALAMDAGVWKITAPTALKADEGAVNDLLFKARDLRAKEFVAEDAKTPARWGLDRPQIRLSVWEKGAKEPKSLLVAPAREKDLAYAAAGGPVVLVDAKALADLSHSPQDLRDRALFGGFDARDVTRVSIQRKAGTLVLERKGEEDWQLVAPRQGKARGGRVNDLLWTLRNLKWRELVAEQGWEPGRYGLDAPATTITLAGKDGKRIAALAIGTREKGEAYVRVPDQPALYAVEPKDLGEIPATPEDLLL